MNEIKLYAIINHCDDAEAVKSFDSGLSALVPLFGERFNQGNLNKTSLSIIDSLIPNSAFDQEPCATEIALGKVEKLGSLQFFNLATFLISNNFPGETSDEKLYKWFTQSGTAVLKTMTSMEGTTVEALREKLFRIAIEAEEVPTVKLLIKAGVDPNGHVCRHSRIPDTMNPFQFACIRGNTELVRILIDAGSVIDQPGNGWKSSGLVLAIIGENFRGRTDFWARSKGDSIFPVFKDQRGYWEYLDDNPDTQETAALFLILIRSLMDAGAAINPKVDESSLESLGGKKGDILAFDRYIHKSDIELRSVMVESHSPLTVASKYRNLKLVDIFLQKGADVNFWTKEGTSALQECLYSTEERALDCHYSPAITPKLLSKREPLFPGAKSLLRVIGVAQSLVDAGADVHGEICWCWLPDSQGSRRHAGRYSTTLDLGVLTESVVLVKIMLRAGGNRTTKYSLEYAIKIGDFELVELLLDIGSPLSSYAIQLAMRIDDGKIIGALLKARPDITTQKMVLVEAIVLGNNDIINQVFERGVTKGRELLHEHHELESALRDCCHSGYIVTLRLIIDKFSMCNVSISPYLGGAVMRAVSHCYDHILDILLSAGADVNAVFDSARTALVIAIEVKNRNAVLRLIAANSIICTETILDRNDKKSTSSCVHYHQVRGDALIMAIEWGDDFVVEKLLNAGASVNALGTADDKKRQHACTCITPLTAAIRKGNSPLVDRLIFSGAAVNNPSGSAASSMTPLAATIKMRHMELADRLIRSGANPYDSLALEEATADFGLLQVLLTALDSSDMTDDSKDVGHGALRKAIWMQDQIAVVSLLDALLKYNKRTDRILSAALLEALKRYTGANCPIFRTILGRGADPDTVFQFGNGTRRHKMLALPQDRLVCGNI